MSDRGARTVRAARRSSRGQVLVIFALLALLLFAATGLAVDAGVSYLTYNGTERAAAAAALAGVPYMPSGYGGVAHCSLAASTQTADVAACAAAARDGYPDQGTLNGHPVVVSESRYPAGCGGVTACAENKLTVTVTAWVKTTFLEVLGFGDHKVTASDTAFYLPPITLGQPGAQLGSQEQDLGSSGNYYILRSEGYGNDRAEGDAYDPITTTTSFTCPDTIGGVSGNKTESTASYGNSTDTHTLSANNSSDVSNSTLTADGFSSLPARGGYDFSIVVPPTVPKAYVRVYNPAFAPDNVPGSNGTGYNPNANLTISTNYGMHEDDSSFSGPAYTNQYSAMAYTLFKVNDIFDHSQDTPISQVIVDPLNVSATAQNGTVTSFTVPTTGNLDMSAGQVLSGSSHAAQFAYIRDKVYHQWVDVGTPPDNANTQWTSGSTYHIFNIQNGKTLQATTGNSYLTPNGTQRGNYRLRIDMLDYRGLDPTAGGSPCSRAHKGYAVQVATCASGSTCPSGTPSDYTVCADTGCQASAIDELAVYTPIATGGFNVPIFQLPSDYAGQTINVYIFDPGDVGGTNTLALLNPDQTSCIASGSAFNTAYPQACLFTSASGVPIYDTGISRPGTPALVSTSCNGSSPVVQPNANQALVNTVLSSWPAGCADHNPPDPQPGTGNVFNSNWLLYQLKIPSTYAAGQNGGGSYWQLAYAVSGGVATDTITVSVTFGGSPVHLVS